MSPRRGTGRWPCTRPSCRRCRHLPGRCQSACMHSHRYKRFRRLSLGCCTYRMRRRRYQRCGTGRSPYTRQGCRRYRYQLGRCPSACTRFHRCRPFRLPCSGSSKRRSTHRRSRPHGTGRAPCTPRSCCPCRCHPGTCRCACKRCHHCRTSHRPWPGYCMCQSQRRKSLHHGTGRSPHMLLGCPRRKRPPDRYPCACKHCHHCKARRRL
jgi:hypothetical protein